jgi:hypothetical protein
VAYTRSPNHADTLERLKITGGAGKPGDDFLWLQDIEVVE